MTNVIIHTTTFTNLIEVQSMERTNTRDSFSTLIDQDQDQDQELEQDSQHHDNDNSDIVSLFSSQETLLNPSITIMNQNITNFTRVYQLPLISHFLHTGVNLYLNWNDIVLNKPPLLSRSPSKLTLFKKTPLMIIHKHNPGASKEEFCKVEFKIHSIHITYYILQFPSLNRVVYLINNNSSKPTVDFKYGDTNFRIYGITGTTSALGTSPEISLFAMSPNSENLLTYDVEINESSSKGKLKIDNKLSKLINCQEQSKINQLMKDEKPIVDIPLAKYLDQGDVKIRFDKHQKNVIKHGIIKIFDWVNPNHNDDDGVSDDMLVICSILLVLREQEYRKFKGG